MTPTERLRPVAVALSACALLLAAGVARADEPASNTAAPPPPTLGPSGRQWIQAIAPSTSLGGKFEISVNIAAQVNTKFTQTAGDGLDLAYHIADPIAIVVGGGYNWQSRPTDFTDKNLIDVGQAPTTPEQISALWDTHLAVEFDPVYAKMAAFSAGTLRWGFYISAGAAVTGTVIELQPASGSTPATTGDAGTRPAGFFNTGFRFVFAEHYALKLEVRDLVFSGYANTIRGCTLNDVTAIQNGTPSQASSACQSAYSGTSGKEDAHLATNLLTDTSTEIVNDLQFAAAFAVMF